MQIALDLDTRQHIQADPDAPKRAVCRHYSASVLLRRRRKYGGVTWYWRYENGHGQSCPTRRLPVSTPLMEVDDV